MSLISLKKSFKKSNKYLHYFNGLRMPKAQMPRFILDIINAKFIISRINLVTGHCPVNRYDLPRPHQQQQHHHIQSTQPLRGVRIINLDMQS